MQDNYSSGDPNIKSDIISGGSQSTDKKNTTLNENALAPQSQEKKEKS